MPRDVGLDSCSSSTSRLWILAASSEMPALGTLKHVLHARMEGGREEEVAVVSKVLGVVKDLSMR